MPEPLAPADMRELADKLMAATHTSGLIVGVGILLLQFSMIALIVIVWTGTQRLNENNQDRAELRSAQTACFNVVQSNYASKVASLAAANQRALQNDQADRSRSLAVAEDLRQAGLLVEQVPFLCYTDKPDVTPLDGDPSK